MMVRVEKEKACMDVNRLVEDRKEGRRRIPLVAGCEVVVFCCSGPNQGGGRKRWLGGGRRWDAGIVLRKMFVES
jgi:hypothetical protein